MKSLTLALLLVLGATLAQGRHGGHHHGHLRAYQLICSIESTTDEVIVMPHGFPQPNGQCPGDSSCTIGPFTANFEGRELQVTLCDALDSDGNLLVFKWACRIELADGTVIERTPRGIVTADQCTQGPLTGYKFNGQDATAFFPLKHPPPRQPREADVDGTFEAWDDGTGTFEALDGTFKGW